MRLNWHIGLPGPFSVSGPVIPRVKPVGRAVSKTIAAERRHGHSCDCRPAAANPRPQDRTISDTGPGGGAVLMGLLIVFLVVLAIAGFAGFRA